MAGVFRPRQDAESENPGTPSALGLLRRGIGPFFWLLFFGPAKKSDPLAGRRVEALPFGICMLRSAIGRFRPLARPSSFLLVDAHARSANGEAGPEGASIEEASQRNGTKEKRLPDEAHPALHLFRDFSTRHPGSIEKRRTSPASQSKTGPRPQRGRAIGARADGSQPAPHRPCAAPFGSGSLDGESSLSKSSGEEQGPTQKPTHACCKAARIGNS